MANPGKPVARSLVAHAIDRLRGRAELVLVEGSGGPHDASVPIEPWERLEAEVLVAFGGDGTLLASLQRSSLPVLGINAGTFGFLSEVDGREPEAMEQALERLLEGRYYVEERMKLGVELDGRPLPDATNEVVVHSSNIAKMRHFEIAVDRDPVGRLGADGVIVSTPTGSTSYSLSALGPLVEPGVEALVVTAIAPFQALQRAVLLDPLRTVTVRLLQSGRDGVVLVDGQEEFPIAAGEPVLVYRSPRKARFIRFAPRFLERLRGKAVLPWLDPFQGLGEEAARDADLSPAA